MPTQELLNRLAALAIEIDDLRDHHIREHSVAHIYLGYMSNYAEGVIRQVAAGKARKQQERESRK